MSNINRQYILWNHLDPEITDVTNFLDQDGLSIVNSLTKQEFLSYDGGTGKSNLDRIWENYTEVQQEEYQSQYNSGTLSELTVNTTLVLPKDKLNREVIAVTGGNQVVNVTNVNAFVADKLSDLLLDPNYRRSEITIGNNRTIYPHLSVWIWLRALSDDNNLKGTLVDVSPFVESIQTNVGPNGGNFQMVLSPIDAVWDEEKGWVLNKASYQQYISNLPRRSYNTHTHIHRIKANQYKRNNFYFHNVINSNDLVFIRFEQLDLETRRARQDRIKVLSVNDIPGNVYDMIGFVDNVPLSSDANANVNITITGRDVSKVLLEDGCYFYPISFADGVFLNNQDNDKIIQRTITGDFRFLGAFAYRPIDYSLRFIINQLSNLGVVPDYLFDGYGDRISTTYRLDGEGQEAVERPMDGIYRIIKLVFDQSIADRRIVDDSIATQSGSIMNFIQKVCQEPFVEFYTDTYGDQFYFIVRQPPFDYTQYRSLVNDAIVVKGSETISEQLDFNDQEVYTMYKLVPQGLFFGDTATTLAYLPVIFFSEYSDIWGARLYEKVTNYVPFTPIVGDKRNESQNYWVRQAFIDLKRIIDINCYLPFTRKGNITINGNRTIKRGTAIYYEPTDEFYYVDNVTNSASIAANAIDRTTTLQLSRGMVRGGSSFETFKKYFQIIDTTLQERFSYNEAGSLDTQRLLANWKVNKDIFRYFIRREQFK